MPPSLDAILCHDINELSHHENDLSPAEVKKLMTDLSAACLQRADAYVPPVSTAQAANSPHHSRAWATGEDDSLLYNFLEFDPETRHSSFLRITSTRRREIYTPYEAALRFSGSSLLSAWISIKRTPSIINTAKIFAPRACSAIGALVAPFGIERGVFRIKYEAMPEPPRIQFRVEVSRVNKGGRAPVHESSLEFYGLGRPPMATHRYEEFPGAAQWGALAAIRLAGIFLDIIPLPDEHTTDLRV